MDKLTCVVLQIPQIVKKKKKLGQLSKPRLNFHNSMHLPREDLHRSPGVETSPRTRAAAAWLGAITVFNANLPLAVWQG